MTNAVSVQPGSVGLGVVSNRPFRARQIVGQVHGEIIADAAYGSSYCMELGDGRAIEPALPFRCLNHSCDPNCELFYFEPDAPGQFADRLYVQALRPIRPGEELTIDYAWPADAAVPCLCGTPSCRGWIVCPDELSAVAPAGPPLPGNEKSCLPSPRNRSR